jgi:nitrate reductase NapD
MTEEATIHISSAVVSVLPDHRDDVLRALALTDVEVHHADASKIVTSWKPPRAESSEAASLKSRPGRASCRRTWCSSIERLADIGG